MGTIVFKSFRLLPGAVSSLQVIVIIISVLDTMFYPHTISAAWRKAKSVALDIVNVVWDTKLKIRCLLRVWNAELVFCVLVQLFKIPLVALSFCLCPSSAWYVSAHSESTALSPALGTCNACSVFLESSLATILLISATAPATIKHTGLYLRSSCRVKDENNTVLMK